MKKRNRCLAIVLVIALLLATVDVGICVKRANAAAETVAYLQFVDPSWYKAVYAYGTNSSVVPDNAIITGDGVYRVSLDFTQVYEMYGEYAKGILSCGIRIKDGEEIYGSESHIQIRSVKIINADGQEKVLTNINPCYTYEDNKNTSLCLHDANNRPNATNVRSVSGKQITGYNDWETSDYQLLGDLVNEEIKSMEVIFAFATNADGLNQIPTDATPKPHTTPDVTESPTTNPGGTATPTPTWNPGSTPTTKPTTNPGVTSTPKPTTTPGGTPTTNPGGNPSTSSNEGFVPPENLVSNSTYNGQEKIFVNKSALVVAAGSHASVTIALLRGATSNTYITATSANGSIAVPTLQPTGKLDIAVPATAPAGSSTTITLRFGNSSAAVKVTVSNPVMKAKGAKKSYTIKRKKTATVTVKLTPKNTAYATTDTATASISKKKIASVSSVKISKNQVKIKVKGLKKGSAKLKVKAGGKSASITIKVK